MDDKVVTPKKLRAGFPRVPAPMDLSPSDLDGWFDRSWVHCANGTKRCGGENIFMARSYSTILLGFCNDGGLNYAIFYGFRASASEQIQGKITVGNVDVRDSTGAL